MINRLIPEIIPVIIPHINPQIADRVAASSAPENKLEGDCHGHGAQRRTCFLRSYGCKLEGHRQENSMGRKQLQNPPGLTIIVRIISGLSVSPTRIVSQEIGSPSGPIGPEEVRNTQPFETSINVISSKHSDPAPTFNKVIIHKLSE